jgi:hypothetical protein
LFLENCAGGVHDQLWQKPLWKETEEIKNKNVGRAALGRPVERSSTAAASELENWFGLTTRRVDYLSLNGENN